MRNAARFPTQHSDVNALLIAILSGVQGILGEQFVGMYLHGSLATGDFDPERSDIDFLVVTAGVLAAAQLAALDAMHRRIAASNLKWRTNYEGSYIPARALRRYDPAHSVHPVVRVDGTFGLEPHGHDWVVQGHIIREHGITLAGPAPTTLIDPVRPDDLRQAVHRTLQEWWKPQLADHSRLQDSEYQAYAVLTMCRALYTLHHGDVASKQAAAHWMQCRSGEWSGLIERALVWRHGQPLDVLTETLDFIRFTSDSPAGGVAPEHREG